MFILNLVKTFIFLQQRKKEKMEKQEKQKKKNKIPEKGKSSLGSPELYDVKWGQKPQKDGTTFLTSNQNQSHDGDRL